MIVTHMHPPANRQCQVYIAVPPEGRALDRCSNQGTHWEKWPGCSCPDPDLDDEMCVEDLVTWECEGPHDPGKEAA